MENNTHLTAPQIGETAYFWNDLNRGYCKAILIDFTSKYYTTMGEFNNASIEAPVAFSQEIEEELPKKGHICWGRRQKSVWFIGHFIEKKEGEYILSPNIEGINSKYYDEITTKNPYEVEEDREPKIGDMVCVWDGDIPNHVVTAELANIDMNSATPFQIKMYGEPCGMYQYCSYKNPLIK